MKAYLQVSNRQCNHKWKLYSVLFLKNFQLAWRRWILRLQSCKLTKSLTGRRGVRTSLTTDLKKKISINSKTELKLCHVLAEISRWSLPSGAIFHVNFVVILKKYLINSNNLKSLRGIKSSYEPLLSSYFILYDLSYFFYFNAHNRCINNFDVVASSYSLGCWKK